MRAYVKVNPNLSGRYKAGIFSNASSYPTFIRFSNGAGRGFSPLSAHTSDCTPDNRGFALKIFGNFGNTILPTAGSVDFQFTTARTAFLDTPAAALSYFQAVDKGKVAFAAWLASHPKLALLFTQMTVNGAIDSMLTPNWWTPVISMHGNVPARYVIYPCNRGPPSDLLNEEQRVTEKRDVQSICPFKDPEYLTLDLQQALTAPVCFGWAAQLWVSNSTTPLDDPTKKWDTNVSPFVEIARIEVPAQYVWSSAQDATCRRMAFNPSHQIQAHKPVGWIQEMRSLVYNQMATLRHALKGQSNAPTTLQDWNNYGGFKSQ